MDSYGPAHYVPPPFNIPRSAPDSRGWSVDLLSHYQTCARGRVHTPQASYHPVHQSSRFANTQGHVLLLAHVQFHYHDAAEVAIAIADSRIISRYLNYQYYRSALHHSVTLWLRSVAQSLTSLTGGVSRNFPHDEFYQAFPCVSTDTGVRMPGYKVKRFFQWCSSFLLLIIDILHLMFENLWYTECSLQVWSVAPAYCTVGLQRFLPAGHTLHAQPAGPKIALHFPH